MPTGRSLHRSPKPGGESGRRFPRARYWWALSAVPVLAAPSALQRDAAWTSVTDPGAAAEWDGPTTVTRSWAWVATPFGAMAT